MRFHTPGRISEPSANENWPPRLEPTRENGSDKRKRRLPSSPSRNRLTSGFALVAYVALVRVALYLVAASHYGYFRDELYYLACGEHPAWGYVDQPPMIAWIAWLLQHTIGTSLYAIRFLPMLAGWVQSLLPHS